MAQELLWTASHINVADQEISKWLQENYICSNFQDREHFSITKLLQQHEVTHNFQKIKWFYENQRFDLKKGLTLLLASCCGHWMFLHIAYKSYLIVLNKFVLFVTSLITLSYNIYLAHTFSENAYVELIHVLTHSFIYSVATCKFKMTLETCKHVMKLKNSAFLFN